MSGYMKSTISKRNKYWIPRDRHNELKYFCFQYSNWQEQISLLSFYPKQYINPDFVSDATTDDVVYSIVERLDFYKSRIELLSMVAKETDPTLWSYLLYGVTNGVSYDAIRASKNIPCCRETYYLLYRKFFWILDRYRK